MSHLDLDKRHGEVAALVLRFYGRVIRSNGLECQDVVQTVLCDLWSRECGAHPFDPSRAAWSTYVCLVARGSVYRVLKRQVMHHVPLSRGKQREAPVDGRETDAALRELQRLIIGRLEMDLDVATRLAMVAGLVASGASNDSIADALGLSKSNTKRIKRIVREAVIYLTGGCCDD